MKKIFIILVLCLGLTVSSELCAREFLNTFMQINLGYSYGLDCAGKITDTEIRHAVDGKKLKYVNSAVNLMLDVVPFKPVYFNMGKMAVKIGIRGGYRGQNTDQTVKTSVNGGSRKEYTGNFMNYHCLCAGPMIRFAPFLSMADEFTDYVAGGGMTFFVMYGRIFGGELNAFAANRACGVQVPEPWKTSLNGSRLDIGIGGEIAVCSANLGLNVCYSRLWLHLRDQVYNEIGKNSTQQELSAEIYIGMPLENIF